MLVSLGMGLAILLLWFMVSREMKSRGLYAEYEAFRISASVQESFRLNPSFKPDNPSILGYGLYDLGGNSITRGGSAPPKIDLAMANPNFILPRSPGSKSSMILFRPLGMQSGPGRGQGFGMGRRAAGNPSHSGKVSDNQDSALTASPAPGFPGFSPLPDEPHFLWLEYSRVELDRGIGFLFAGATLLSLLMAGLYAATLRLYGRNETLRMKELENRELVQLGEAARTLVHEIKNPLGIIRIQAVMLRKTGNERVTSSALVIEDEVMRLAGLADRIREFLKSGSGDVQVIEMGPWLEVFADRYGRHTDESGELAPVENPGLSLDSQLGDLRARVDPERLTQALDNLVVNAVDAMAGLPAVTPPLIHARRKGAMIVISVLDRGIGVASGDRERIFEPFFTTKEKGSGIGLALARKVARSAGGDLLYEDRQGGGACFSLLLPCA